MRIFTGTLALALALGTMACEKKSTDAPKQDKAADKSNDDKKSTEKPSEDGGTLELTKLGLTAKGVKGASVGKAIGGDGHMVRGPGLVVTVVVATDKAPKDIAAAKEDASMYSPQEWKEEKLDDGWLVTFQNKGGMGTNYWVSARREIGGKAYTCSTTASQPEQQTNAVNFCKSLKAK